ncbi:hypothetical protein Bca4012_077520 [Brassica carinata]|uniref:Uncharacterized protein n=1 Tax=Brassica carinata TaxID=52824 RepID=A0A8X8B4R4_BRACI|nr:hypothetical protein Bca52824_014375 [Brassica carinata]
MADSPLWTIFAEIDVSRQALHRCNTVSPRGFASAVSQVRWKASTSCHILRLCCDLFPLSMTSGGR